MRIHPASHHAPHTLLTHSSPTHTLRTHSTTPFTRSLSLPPRYVPALNTGPTQRATIKVTIPANTPPCDGCVLQYLWDSSDNKLYYGCADVKITAAPGGGGGIVPPAVITPVVPAPNVTAFTGTVTMKADDGTTTVTDAIKADFRAGLMMFLGMADNDVTVLSAVVDNGAIVFSYQVSVVLRRKLTYTSLIKAYTKSCTKTHTKTLY